MRMWYLSLDNIMIVGFMRISHPVQEDEYATRELLNRSDGFLGNWISLCQFNY